MVISYNPETKVMKISGDDGQLMSNPQTESSRLSCRSLGECSRMVAAVQTATGKTLEVQSNPNSEIFIFREE